MVNVSEIVQIRPYDELDGESTLATFLTAVTVTAATDYSAEQIAAWSAPDERDCDEWNRARMSSGTIVATVDADVVGFSDVSATGYIDMLFVSPEFTRQGVARALLSAIERRAIAAGATTLSTDASITARPFFQQHGFQVVLEQHPIVRDVRMTNYRMLKILD
jgi:putative acetyltransferase